MSVLTKKVPLICPACEVYSMQAVGVLQALCPGCGFELEGEMFETLVEVLTLPEALGRTPARSVAIPRCDASPIGSFTAPHATPMLRPWKVDFAGWFEDML